MLRMPYELQPAMRSKLFVPGSRPELFGKALASNADAISIDLEDSVAELRKEEARSFVNDFLRTIAVASNNKMVIVRVNALDTPHFEADLRAVVQPRLRLINLPKLESAEEVHAAVDALQQVERSNGVIEPTRLLLNIETPKGLRRAHEIAMADSRVVGVQLGLADLFEPLGIARGDLVAVQSVMMALRLAAGEAGVFAYDAAFADIRDVESFRAQAQMARRLGFLGKSCIHPSQVALANEIFRPSNEEIAHALKVVTTAREADAKGLGAYVVDGKMIDGPFLRRAEAVIDAARRLGFLNG